MCVCVCVCVCVYNGSNNKIYENSGLPLFTQFFNRDENDVIGLVVVN